MRLQLKKQEEMPLLSIRDARLLVIAITLATQKEVDLCLEHIRIRHQKRQNDKFDLIPEDVEFDNSLILSTQFLR